MEDRNNQHTQNNCAYSHAARMQPYIHLVQTPPHNAPDTRHRNFWQPTCIVQPFPSHHDWRYKSLFTIRFTIFGSRRVNTVSWITWWVQNILCICLKVCKHFERGNRPKDMASYLSWFLRCNLSPPDIDCLKHTEPTQALLELIQTDS